MHKMVSDREYIKSVETIEDDDDYVYDISMKHQDPFFFANDVLVHNTDSIYYSMYPVYKDKIDSGEIPWSKEIVMELYDEIANQVNASFPDFMISFFNVPRVQGEIIKAGRENAATMGIFIKKKRYAMLIYDDDGVRKDVGNVPGKIKAMGLDLKRSDTPDYMQEFLKDVLMSLLTIEDKDLIIGMIKDFKREFAKKPSWEKGTPKRVNNLTNHTKNYEKTGKCGVGHAMAAINWNRLRKMNHDSYSMEITDGMKTIVCKLRPNAMGISSIAYPIDEKKLPKWFRELPFDNDLMEHTIITKKVNNLIGVLNWDLSDTNNSETFDNLFEF